MLLSAQIKPDKEDDLESISSTQRDTMIHELNLEFKKFSQKLGFDDFKEELDDEDQELQQIINSHRKL